MYLPVLVKELILKAKVNSHLIPHGTFPRWHKSGDLAFSYDSRVTCLILGQTYGQYVNYTALE